MNTKISLAFAALSRARTFWQAIRVWSHSKFLPGRRPAKMLVGELPKPAGLRDKVPRSKAPLLFQSALFLRLCQFGRLFLFPVVQQGHNLFFHLGGSNLLAKILREFR